MIKETIGKMVVRCKEVFNNVCTKGYAGYQAAGKLVKSGRLGGVIQENQEKIFFAYKAILTLLYAFFQYPRFGYSGYASDLDFLRLIIGWLVYIGTVRMIRTDRDDVCSMFLYTIFMLSIAPFIVIYEFDASYKLWMILLQVACLLFMRFLFSLNLKLPESFRGISYKNTKLRLVATVTLAAYLVYCLWRFGLPVLSSLSFNDVHQIRAEVNLSTFESILQNVLCKAICPVYLVVTLKEKRWGWFAFALLVQLYTYSVTGFKSYLFIPVILIALQLVPKLSVKKTILAGLPLGSFFLGLLYSITHSNMLYALIGDRIIFMPARIKFSYFDYFSQYDFVYFSQNSFSKIFGIQSNYSTPVPYLIGELYFNKPEMWTNTGFMADAYSNLGVLGMVLMATLLAAVLIVLRYALRSADGKLQKAIQSIFVTFFIALNDGPVISELFSGGMLVAVAVVLLIDFGANAKEGVPLMHIFAARRKNNK